MKNEKRPNILWYSAFILQASFLKVNGTCRLRRIQLFSITSSAELGARNVERNSFRVPRSAFRVRETETTVIHVSKLTKYYGDYPAVRDVSFDVPKGQVVGFLGPNGAGKSTTMRILAGYLTATSGRATIDGLDVFWNPVEVRRRIGYMPESCPLYSEMRVTEYLTFRGGIKGLHGSACRRRVELVLDRCWLTDVRRQLIGTLSKGYRQRVGLADALLHNPPVLILDEPTAGLDPAQIIETRKLIRDLGQEHTILLSTHILAEVEVTCDQAIIIHRGRVAAAGRLEEIRPHNQSLEEMFIRLIERQDSGAVFGVH
jgi:ABC-2 type transport system ATP-binding protein